VAAFRHLPLRNLCMGGKLHEFSLRPLEGHEPREDRKPADSVDVSFELDPVAQSYPGSWVLLTSRLMPLESAVSTRLFVDTGKGLGDRATFDLHVSRTGRVHEVIRLPSGVRRMLWQSASATGEFKPQALSIREIGVFERIWHMICRIVPAYIRHSPRKRRNYGLTLTGVLVDLPAAYEAAGRLRLWPATAAYQRWLRRHDALGDRDLDLMRRHIGRMKSPPLISVLMPVFNAPERLLRDAIESVLGQIYPRWELCVADDASSDAHVRPLLEEYARRDARIKVVYQTTNGHISRASNAALLLATGDFIALLDHDDVIAPHGLYWIAAEIERHPAAQIVYTDEDKIDEHGERFSPYCKPDWNPQLALSQNFVSHFGVYRAETVRALGGFREGYEGSQDYDLMLRVSEHAGPNQIRHVPAIVYHWRAVPGSTALSSGWKNYAWDAGRRAIQDHLRRKGVDAVVTKRHGLAYYRVRYALPEPPPRVSIVIPAVDDVRSLCRCVESIVALTTYSNYNVFVIHGESTEPPAVACLDSLQDRHGIRVLRCAQPFNVSAMSNLAVAQADGEVICLLDHNTEVITADWIQEMAGCLLQAGVGIVGARLLSLDDTVLHGGVLVGVGGIANPAHASISRDQPGYFGRAWLAQDWSAVTGACMMIRRSLYDEIGGLDAEHLAMAFNDIDFCLRARAAGWRVVYTPYAELYRHKSATRGAKRSVEETSRVRRERDYMRRRWARELGEDPFYNPNLGCKQPFFSLSRKPRVKKPWLAA
jgi:glycosyltransferase involved in cell wall biosynthesis